MKYIVYVTMLFSALLFTSCADAGEDKKVKSGVEVTLDGSKSTPDFFGKIKKYKWKQIKGTKVKLLGKKSVNPSFKAPTVETKTKLIFKLVTVEKGGEISPWKTKDNVTVFVSPNEVTHNPPVAKITVSNSDINYGDTVTFSAINSSDADGSIVSYEWLNAKNTTLSTEQEFTYKFSTAEEHTITLKVTDNDGLVGSTTKTVVVKAVLASVTLEVNTTTLNINDTTQAKVIAHYNDNSSKELTNNITWNISNNTVISIDENLEVKALSSGTSTIQAKVDELSSSVVSLEVLTPDVTAPIIRLNGDANITLTKGQAYIELGATAVDDVDGNVSVSISGSVDTATVGVYTITYMAVDSANNSTSKSRIVNVVEKANNEAPVITLIGDSNMTMYLNQIYIEENATAIDIEDGNVSVVITGDVNSSQLGVYKITYTATDSDGHTVVKTRDITVIAPPSPSDIARDFVTAYLANDNVTMETITSKKMIDKLKTIDLKVKKYFNLIGYYPSMKYFHDLKALVVGVATENGQEVQIKFYFNWVGSHWIMTEVL